MNKHRRRRAYHPKKKRFAAQLQPDTYSDKTNRVTVKGDTDGPIKKTDKCWVPIPIAAILFKCSQQTIRLLHVDGKVKGLKYPRTGTLVWLPDILFYEVDEDDYFMEDLTH